MPRCLVHAQRLPWSGILARLIMISAAVMTLANIAVSQSPRPATSRHERQLSTPVTIAWQDAKLATALDRLAESQSIFIWQDRRVDPNLAITLTASDQAIDAVLAALGERASARAIPFAGVIYFGPQQTADELATLAELARAQLAKAPAAVRAGWLKPRPWTYDRLSQPRRLLTELTASVGAKVQNDSRVPHDLWAARKTPALAPIDQAVLLLAGFDLTCRLSADGRQLQVIPIERPVAVSREYRVPASRAAAFQTALAEMPTAASTGDESRPTIAARVEQHEQLKAAISGRPASVGQAATPQRASRPTAGSRAIDDRRFTLTIANKPLAPVLNQLASQLNLQIEWDAAIPETASGRDVLVSCEVAKANLDDLLQSLLHPVGLTFTREASTISIRRQ